MTSTRLILAVDVGTSGARAVLFDDRAEPVAQARKSYPIRYPQPGWSEQDVDEVADAVIHVLREMVASAASTGQLEGVVLSAQMYSILAVDSAGHPLTPSLTWGDTRAASTADAVRKHATATLAPRTGCPTQAIYPLSKIRWLRENANLSDTARFVSVKDYVIFRLTGRWLSDWSTASASGLLNITRRGWDDEALTLATIRNSALPELASPREILYGWRHDVHTVVGISDTVPLILGAGDAPLANIGAGAVEEGSLAINMGTSAAVRALTSRPETDPAGHLWTYVADVDHWVIGGIVGSGGLVFDWLLKELLAHDAAANTDELFREAEQMAQLASPGADDLLFIPYVSGEQSPGWNPTAKGAFYGLTLRHKTAHVVRAAMEGLVFALLRIIRRIEALRTIPTSAGYVTGGLSTSTLMRRALADAVGIPVIVPPSPESSARGAAILAWLALGAAERYSTFAQPVIRLEPDLALHPVYESRFAAFCALNEHLQMLGKL